MHMTQEELHGKINDFDQVYQNYANLKNANDRLQRKYHRSLLSLKAARDECQLYKDSRVTPTQYASLVEERDELQSQLSHVKNEYNSFVNDSHIRYQSSCRNLEETSDKYNDLLKECEELRAENKLVTELCSNTQNDEEINNLQSLLDEKCKENECLRQKLSNYIGFQTKFGEMLTKNKALSEERDSLHLKVQSLEADMQRTIEGNRLEFASLKDEHCNLLIKFSGLEEDYKCVSRERDDLRSKVYGLENRGMEVSFKNLMMELRGVVRKYDVRSFDNVINKNVLKSNCVEAAEINCDIDSLTSNCTDICERRNEDMPKTIEDESDVSVDEELFTIITKSIKCVKLISPIPSPLQDNCTSALSELDNLMERSIMEDADDESFLNASLLNVRSRQDLLKSSDWITATTSPISINEEIPELLDLQNFSRECDSSQQSPCEGSLDNKVTKIGSANDDIKSLDEKSNTSTSEGCHDNSDSLIKDDKSSTSIFIEQNLDNLRDQSLDAEKCESDEMHLDNQETTPLPNNLVESRDHELADAGRITDHLSKQCSEIETNVQRSDDIGENSDDGRLEQSLVKEAVPSEIKEDTMSQLLSVFSPQSTYSETTDSAFFSNCSSSDDEWIDNFVDDLATNTGKFSTGATPNLRTRRRTRSSKSAKKRQKIDNEFTLGFEEDKVIISKVNTKTKCNDLKAISKIADCVKGSGGQSRIVVEQLACGSCAGYNSLRKKRKRSLTLKLCPTGASVATEAPLADLKRNRIPHSPCNSETNKRLLGEGKINLISVHVINPTENVQEPISHRIVDLSDREDKLPITDKSKSIDHTNLPTIELNFVDIVKMDEPINNGFGIAISPEKTEDALLQELHVFSPPKILAAREGNMPLLLSPLSSELESTASYESMEETEVAVRDDLDLDGTIGRESAQDHQPSVPVLPKVKRPDVTKMTVDKGRHLIKEMLQFCKCNEKIFQIAKLFVHESADFIAKLILEHVVFDIHEIPTKGDYPREPPLTTIQRGLYKFVMALEKLEVRGVSQSYFKQADLYLRTIEDPLTLSPVTRLYVTICKGQFNYRQIRMAICSAFADMGDLVLPYVYVVLQMWIDVFPRQGIVLHNHLLMRAMVQIILLKNVSQPEYNLVNLRYLLFNYYRFSSDCEDSKTLLKELIKYYIDERNECARVLAIALAKHLDLKIVMGEIFSTLRAQGAELRDDNKICAVITMVMHLTKHLDLSPQSVAENLQWLKQFGADLQPFIVKSHANYVLQWYMKCNFIPFTILEIA